MSEELGTPFLPFPKWVNYAVILWMILGSAPFLPYLIGVQFLPSTDWVSLMRAPAKASGIIMSLLFFLRCLVVFNSDEDESGALMIIGTVFFLPVMGFIVGSTSISYTAPMLEAIIRGVETEATYTVGDVPTYSDVKCPRQFHLEDMPMMSSKVCGFSEEFRRSLETGGQILFSGRGTERGLFIQTARRID